MEKKRTALEVGTEVHQELESWWRGDRTAAEVLADEALWLAAKRQTYDEWIERRIAEKYQGEAWRTRGMCRLEAEALAAEFPELRVVKGHVTAWWLGDVRREAHWWCETENGDIVDPTVGQFTCGCSGYEELKEGDLVKVGCCMNCGEEIWGQIGEYRCICSDECHVACVRYLEREREE